MILPKFFEGSVLLFDNWNPVKEGRTDIGEKDTLGEVWLVSVQGGYDCNIIWYKKYWIFKSVISEENLFHTRGGGALKAMIRTTNLYFNREDDVEGGKDSTDWDEW